MNERSIRIDAEKGHFVYTSDIRQRKILCLVYTFSSREKFVNTLSMASLCLVLVLVSCKTPKVIDQSHEENRIEATSTEHETTLTDDTTTIRHTIINDTTMETTIIRKTITQNDKTAQNLQKENHEASRQVQDTYTPAIINKLLKGLAVACIGIVVLVAGFIVLFFWMANRRKM